MSVRVLHVCEPTHAGAARVAFNLADRLRDEGFSPVVATPDGELARWSADAGIEVLELPFARREPKGYPLTTRVLRRAIAAGGYGLVHAHSSFSGVLARAARPRTGPALVFQPHAWSFLALGGGARRASVLAERALARRTDLLVCVSDEELALARAQRIRPRRAVVIRNGVDFDAAVAPPLDPPGSDGAPVRIGCVARLAPQKGIDVLLRALANPCWPAAATLEVIGDGPLQDELPGLAAELGVAERVRFAGRVTDVAARLARFDLFVLPARYEAGAPIALLEALAAGCPAVCTDVAGVRELATGPLAAVAIDDPVGLAVAVAGALADWPATRAAAIAMRAEAAERYSLRAQAIAMASAYRTLTPASAAVAVG